MCKSCEKQMMKTMGFKLNHYQYFRDQWPMAACMSNQKKFET